MLINSKEYWNKRFNNDWLNFSGDRQTEYFAELLCTLMPNDIKSDISKRKLRICDFGCALGQSLPIFSDFFKTDISGIDFSEEAIKIAKNNYPNFKFYIDDINNPSNNFKFDVLILSNILEHFKEPWKSVSNISDYANEYIIIMVPFHETLEIDEHEYKFTEKNISLKIDQFTLCYSSYASGNDKRTSLYPENQILLIYKKNNIGSICLNDISESIVSYALENTVGELTKIREQQEKQIEEASLHIDELTKIREQQEKQIEEASLHIDELTKIREQQEKQIEEASLFIQKLQNFTSYKIINLYYRLKHQLLFGSYQEKKLFLEWILNKISRKNQLVDYRFNNLANIYKILNYKPVFETHTTNIRNKTEYKKINEILSNEYKKYDVIVFSVIDYDFRFQRPQHIASHFSKNGHRVFYINANFINQNRVIQKSSNLYILNIDNPKDRAIYYTDYKDKINFISSKLDEIIEEYCIRDAVCIIDYPNWIHTVLKLKEKYGFKIVADYMDDYTGFLMPAENILKNNCVKLLKMADGVVASSKFLYDIAIEFNKNVTLIRNGTEYIHFNAAYSEKKCTNKIIGYYGAVAEWFDYKKIQLLAQRFPEYSIQIIGAVTKWENELSKFKNIELIGEINYKDLPHYLQSFDVCLIPFDTSTDLIKATNPVKFYEYLSAGKKIVATEIPELKPFEGKYVYLTNDDDLFCEYVELCMSGNDNLADPDKCMNFAKNNDWENRNDSFEKFCTQLFPMISIIVLTYNNLKYNKLCINSIYRNTAYPNFELIIVDNNSTDGTVDYLKSIEGNYHNLKIIYNKKNNGFAGGNNIGIRASKGDYVVLLNNDTLVTRGWIIGMLKHLESNNEIAMCGPVTNAIGNEAMIKAQYSNINELDVFAYNYTFNHISDVYNDVNVLALFCTMIRKSVINNCGLLDESYKVGMFEDDDYSENVKRAGFKIIITESSFIHHFESISFKKLEDKEYKIIFDSNKIFFETKWNKKWQGHNYRAGINWDTNCKTKI